MNNEKEELTIPWIEKIDEPQVTSLDPDYVAMLAELNSLRQEI